MELNNKMINELLQAIDDHVKLSCYLFEKLTKENIMEKLSGVKYKRKCE